MTYLYTTIVIFFSDLVSYQNYWRIAHLSLNMKNNNSEAYYITYLLTSVDVCFNDDELVPYEKR